jgi:asparagine synthase (glutamine-hydrolysing)
MTSTLKRLYSPAVKAELDGYDAREEVLELLPDGYPEWDSFAQAQHLEATILMPGYILSSQGDRMAMGHSVEGRFPFLDHRVAEFAAAMPPRMKMKVLNEKHSLKRAARDLVPESVARRPKQPYRAPDAESFLGNAPGKRRPEYVDDLLSLERLQADGLFNPIAVDKLLKKFEQGRAIGIRDNMALVGVLSTQLLVEQFTRSFRS